MMHLRNVVKLTCSLYRRIGHEKTILYNISHTSKRYISCTNFLLERRNAENQKAKNARSKKFANLIENMDQMINSMLKYVPILHRVYQQMGRGFQHQLKEYKIWRSVSATLKENPNYRTSYREQKSIFNIKASLLKSTALIPLFLMPMGIFIIFIPIGIFPQYVLPRCYWNPKQRKQFLTQMHNSRLQHNGIIIHHMTYLKDNHSSPAFQRSLSAILDTMNEQKIPTNDQILNLKQWCRNNENALNLQDMPPLLLGSFSTVNLLWKYQPSQWNVYHLQRRVHLILELDRKLEEENLVYELSDNELQDATFLRGLNSAQLSKSANQYWLQNWIKHTKLCDEMDSSYLLHAMVLQSHNFTELKYRRKPFG